MKVISLILLSTFVFGRVGVKIEYKNNDFEKIIFKKNIFIDFNKIKKIKIPKTNSYFEIKIIEKNPNLFHESIVKKKKILINVNIVEDKDNLKKIMANPQMITHFNREAIFTKYEINKELPLIELRLEVYQENKKIRK